MGFTLELAYPGFLRQAAELQIKDDKKLKKKIDKNILDLDLSTV